MRTSVVASLSRRLSPLVACQSVSAVSRPSSLSSSLSRRLFSSERIYVDWAHGSPDGVYRRVPVPMPRAPLAEDDELTWADGQAPEPVFDRYVDIIEPRTAVLYLVSALVLLVGGGSAVIRLIDPANRQPLQPQQFPFDELRVEMGGPARAASTKSASDAQQTKAGQQ